MEQALYVVSHVGNKEVVGPIVEGRVDPTSHGPGRAKRDAERGAVPQPFCRCGDIPHRCGAQAQGADAPVVEDERNLKAEVVGGWADRFPHPEEAGKVVGFRMNRVPIAGAGACVERRTDRGGAGSVNSRDLQRLRWRRGTVEPQPADTRRALRSGHLSRGGERPRADNQRGVCPVCHHDPVSHHCVL